MFQVSIIINTNINTLKVPYQIYANIEYSSIILVKGCMHIADTIQIRNLEIDPLLYCEYYALRLLLKFIVVPLVPFYSHQNCRR